ncbi:MAG: hypothetical protein K6E15_05085 [Prevotella sp.]|nr:hypothetical protein [Prevotella sp.]
MNKSPVQEHQPQARTASTAGRILRYIEGNTAVQTPEYSGTAYPYQP